MELIRLDRLQQVLQEYGEKAVEIYKYQVSVGGHNASRDLINSVKAQVQQNGAAWEVSLNLLEYWKYLEGGSKGTRSSYPGAAYPAHFPPPWALERWIEVKPVIPQPDARGRIPTPKQLSYAIAHSIERKGTKPHPALATTIEELNAQYRDKIFSAFSADVGDYISKVIRLDGGKMMQNL